VYNDTQQVKIIVQKQTCPDGSLVDFTFNPSWSATDFVLSDGEGNESGWLAPGTYSVVETVPAGWVIGNVTKNGALFTNGGDIVLTCGQTATIVYNDTQLGHVVVEKTVNGAPPTATFYFTLTGPGIGTIEGNTTAGNTTVDFGGVYLQPGTYTLCERYVQSGWTFGTDGNWTMNKSSGGGNQTVTPTLADPIEARYCYTFQVACGETVTFYIDNVTPGGCPRTPGYWKNWNMCKLSEPNQYNRLQMALANDFWLMEDFLPMQIGDLTITNCTQGIKVLNSDDQIQLKKGMPVNRSDDAAYKLARNLFAAKLNLCAGACTDDIASVVTAAQSLLDRIGFIGQGSYLPSGGKPSADRTLALSLASQLDQYNNGDFCGGCGE
jgi:hypothetical protein